MEDKASQSADPFFLRLVDENYYRDQSNDLPMKWPRYQIVIYIVLGLLIIGVYFLSATDVTASYLGLFMTLGGLVLAFGYPIYNTRRHRRLVREGRIVMGVLTEIKGKGISKLFTTRGSDHQITAHFRVETAPGEELEGYDYTIRNDLREMHFLSVSFAPLPAPGTPIALVYVDAQTYQML